jgi:hypothetical protein
VGPLGPAFQDHQLLPQGHDFQSQVMTRPNKASEPREHTPNQYKHESVLYQHEKVVRSDLPDRVLATYRGMKHEDRAARLGVKPQQIHRYEISDHQTANFARVREILGSRVYAFAREWSSYTVEEVDSERGSFGERQSCHTENELPRNCLFLQPRRTTLLIARYLLAKAKRSAKPLFTGSTPVRASNNFFR